MTLSLVPSPTDLRRARLERKGPERRAKLGARLSKAGADVTTGTIEARATVVLFIDMDGCPQVEVQGDISWREISDALDAADHLARSVALFERQPTGHDIADHFNERLREKWERHREGVALSARKRADEAARLRWQCEHCPKRFETERGAATHERTCYRNPQARRYTSGDYRPLLDAAGLINGYEANLRPAS